MRTEDGRRRPDASAPVLRLQPSLKRRFAVALAKSAFAILLASACAIIPLAEWAPIWLTQVQAPLTGLVLICYLGKLLYDTLFYDHYRP